MDLLSWTKYTYVCDPDECDSLIEYTCSDKFGFPSGSVTNITCPCGRKPNLLSVEDATITPINQPEQKEEKMETMYNSIQQELDLTNGNEITELKNKLSASENLVERYRDMVSSANSQLGKIIDNLTEDYWYSSSVDKSEILTELCDILEHNPVKEISFTATISFNGRLEIPLDEAEDFDLTAVLEDAYVDINNGNVVIDGYELYDAEEC